MKKLEYNIYDQMAQAFGTNRNLGEHPPKEKKKCHNG